jgi:diguanylate cyclase (GGDEF)-like protein
VVELLRTLPGSGWRWELGHDADRHDCASFTRWPVWSEAGERIGSFVLDPTTSRSPELDRAVGLSIRLASMATEEQHKTHAARSAAARLEAEACTDALTGVANRRGWDNRLLEDEARPSRSGAAAVVVVVDVDDLKHINDEYGHLAGDFTLQSCAGALRACLRPADFAARVGGDEFAVLAGEWCASSCEELVVRIEQALVNRGVQASVGAALRRPGQPLSTVYAAADRAMYAAKHIRSIGVTRPA